MERNNLTKNTYGRLKVIMLYERKQRKDKKGYKYYYLCKCQCGKEVIVAKENLQNGSTISCGCYRKERALNVLSKINTTHNGSKEKLYGVWSSMKDRCNNKRNRMYFYYGGRGITVCKEWENNYSAFRDWAMANGYQQGLELDRIDNNKNYSPDNCRFISHKDNLMNRNNTIKEEINGNKYTLEELSKLYNINKLTIQTRYRRGKRNEELIEPVKPKNKNCNSYLSTKQKEQPANTIQQQN